MPLSFPTSEIASIELYYVFFVDSVKKKVSSLFLFSQMLDICLGGNMNGIN